MNEPNKTTSGEQTATAENTQTTEAKPTAPDGKAADTSKEPAVSAEKQLREQLDEAKAEAAKNLDGWQRATAEFVNYRKRIDKERSEVYATAAVDAYKKIIPIIDDFDRAVSFVPAEKQADQAVDGFKQIHRKMLNLLEAAGVKQINPVGEAFDPAFHEAIGQDEGTGKPAGTVTVVLQKGYVYGDKVLRAALVRVAG